MAENFGAQFTVARKAADLTIGEVASKIKIGEEYLQAIERGDCDFQLPGVYIRGFIRNYAKFLKLDVDAVMAECPIPEDHIADTVKYNNTAFAESANEEKVGDAENGAAGPKNKKLQGTLSNLGKKLLKFSKKRLAILGGIGVAILLILAVIFEACERKNPLDLKGITPVAPELIPSKSITLMASGPVRVVVRTRETLEKIYAGNLSAGTAKAISYYRPVQIFYDCGEHLLVQQDNGEKIYPQPGRGGIEIK
ncbi:MAG: helix-turn-helix domain-containing protein [Puniceicoccales bacterium]|jgi:transcriptional regulator with XRE-family HTH domain|nr:helix-turn-helix domain-containing protein [Puniceicoccales bacterium]